MNMLDARSRDLRRLIKPVYEKLIDMGAHPNFDGVGESIRLESASDGTHTLSTVFSSAEVAPFRAAVRQHIGVLHIGFELVRTAAPERLERVGVTAQVSEILSSVGVQVLSPPAR